jgi:hypothetical protein
MAGAFDLRLHRSATIAGLIGFGLVNIVGGSALVAAGIAYLCGRHNMLGIAATVGGTAIIADGVPFPSETGALLSLTAICGGLVVTGFGVAACPRAPTFAAARAEECQVDHRKGHSGEPLARKLKPGITAPSQNHGGRGWDHPRPL